MTTNLITYTIKTDSYNDNRYGKHYIGLCDPKTLIVTRWGDWFGSPGYAGELTIDLPGHPCILLRGQKDNRVMKNNAPTYRFWTGTETLKDEGGDLVTTSSKLDARDKLATLVVAFESAKESL